MPPSPEFVPAEVDAAVTRLFALLGVHPPAEGSVIFDFNAGRLAMVRPTSVIRIQREKGLASGSCPAHTQQRR